MKRAILITGGSGVGKSTLAEKLTKLGYEACDMDDYPKLFSAFNKETKKRTRIHYHSKLEEVKLLEWVCDVKKLKSILDAQINDLAFYCGSATNIDEIIPLFDKTILLTMGPETTRQRLTDRTNNDFGKNKEVQDWILTWQYDWDNKIGRKSSAIINAEQDFDTVAEEVIKAATS